jgi:hypothetical protein
MEFEKATHLSLYFKSATLVKVLSAVGLARETLGYAEMHEQGPVIALEHLRVLPTHACICNAFEISLHHQKVVNLVSSVVAHVFPRVVLCLFEEGRRSKKDVHLGKITQATPGIIDVCVSEFASDRVVGSLRGADRRVYVGRHDEEFVMTARREVFAQAIVVLIYHLAGLGCACVIRLVSVDEVDLHRLALVISEPEAHRHNSVALQLFVIVRPFESSAATSDENNSEAERSAAAILFVETVFEDDKFVVLRENVNVCDRAPRLL